MEGLTIYPARRVRTVDPARPLAEALAVADGRVVGVGTINELRRWGDARIDARYEDSVLVPGFVEAHSHVFEGGMWAFEYVGAFDRRGPDGVVRAGCRTLSAFLDRLRALDGQLSDPAEPLIVWGFDPIHLPDDRLVAAHLDTVSGTRPIFVFHASGHLATVNTALMRAEGFADGIDMEGVPVGAAGRPIGELQEPAAMSLARSAFAKLFVTMTAPDAVDRLGALAVRSGTTTLTDLGTVMLNNDQIVDGYLQRADDLPMRLSLFLNPTFGGPDDPDHAAERALELRAKSTDRLRLGHVKIVLDGSIQGFTARLAWPGYLDGRPNGIWLLPPERFEALFSAMHRAGVLVHVHCNGDEATEMFIETLERIQLEHPRLDHRHTVQHAQLTTPAQFRRLRALGACVNLFANHLWYWGDQHRDQTVGPDRAARMNACGTALREGVPFSIHSDASITPLGHLHTMWCAVNRRTVSGDVLGPEERISPEDALRAATIGAAYQLRMDQEVGSLEPGKRADVAVLAVDPLEVEPDAIRDIEVRGTMVGGVVHDA